MTDNNKNIFLDQSIGTFGNEEKVDYFRLLEIEGSHLIVGAA